MKRIFAIFTAFFISAPLQAMEPWYPITPFTDPKIYKEGDWELRIYYLQKGTGSEGMNGDLLFQGKRLVPVVWPRYIQTPFGGVTFFPSHKHLAERLDIPNIVIGWTFRDFSKIPWTTSSPPAWAQRTGWVQVDFQLAE